MLGATLAVALMPFTMQVTLMVFVEQTAFRQPMGKPDLDSNVYIAGLAWFPSLLSATICWRITRRWHSPEPVA